MTIKAVTEGASAWRRLPDDVVNGAKLGPGRRFPRGDVGVRLVSHGLHALVGPDEGVDGSRAVAPSWLGGRLNDHATRVELIDDECARRAFS